MNDSLLKSIKEEAERLNIPIISDVIADYLKTIIQTKNLKNILEIGSGNGYSSYLLWRFSNGFVTTIEISEDSYKRCLKNIGSIKNIYCINNDAKIEIKNFYKDKKKFDFVFIDANKREYLEYFKLADLVLKRKGIIVFDNVLLKKKSFTIKKNYEKLIKRMRDFRENIFKSKSHKAKLINIEDGILLVEKR